MNFVDYIGERVGNFMESAGDMVGGLFLIGGTVTMEGIILHFPKKQ